MEKFLEHENQGYPSSISGNDKLKTANKGDLREPLEALVSSHILVAILQSMPLSLMGLPL